MAQLDQDKILNAEEQQSVGDLNHINYIFVAEAIEGWKLYLKNKVLQSIEILAKDGRGSKLFRVGDYVDEANTHVKQILFSAQEATDLLMVVLILEDEDEKEDEVKPDES